jgi:hypothetical protein
LPDEELVHGELGAVRILYLQAGSLAELGQRLAVLLSEHMTDEEDCHVSYSSMQSGWHQHAAPRRGVFGAPEQPWTELFFTYSALVVLRPRQGLGDRGADPISSPTNVEKGRAMTAVPTYQTVRLGKGKHRSPEDGACVVEFASMLEGSRFSDRVHCVDPAIGAFLWGYNDHISDELRQSLYRCAAQVLDTRGGNELAARRAEMCRTWARQARALRPRRLVLLRGAYLHVLWSLRFRRRGSVDLADCELAGAYAASMARRDPAWHTWTLAFIDMLVWLGSGGDESVTPAAVVALPRTREEEIATPRSSAPLVGANA